MGQEFNELSETNVTDAWKMYRRRLMENFGILCEVMSPKDITEMSMKIDENQRGKNPGEGGSPLDAVRNFLNDAVH
jgi:predicted alternative tryptophan synthase beta-subunit